MRRPPLIIGSAAVAVLVAASIMLAVLVPPQRPGPVVVGALGSPNTSSERAPTPAPSVLLPAAHRSLVPVFLIHGYAGAPSQMRPLADRLKRDGRTVVSVQLPERGLADIRVSTLSLAVQAHRLGASEVDVVGYSLGGIVARQWLLMRDPTVHIRHLVMLATPNYGVSLPDYSGLPEEPHCKPTNACGELAADSPLLRTLNASPEAQGQPGWLTVASDEDRLVHPPTAVALPGARNVVLQDICPGIEVDHGQMDNAAPILGLVSLFLDDRLPARPSCGDAVAADVA